ncbi:MAG: hypothetical protein WDM77_11145 [Steroidobacteraceae bacterium]
MTEGFPPQDAQLKRRGTAWLGELAAQRGARELLAELKELPDPNLSEDETEVLGVLARLLELAVAELDGVFREMGRVDYPAMAAAARDALGSVDVRPTWHCAWTAAFVTSWSMNSRTPPWSRRACSRCSRRGGSRGMVARSFWSGTRCSPSTGFARRRWACFWAHAPPASAALPLSR